MTSSVSDIYQLILTLLSFINCRLNNAKFFSHLDKLLFLLEPFKPFTLLVCDANSVCLFVLFFFNNLFFLFSFNNNKLQLSETKNITQNILQ